MCDSEFGGGDCSVSLTTPPEVIAISSGPLCDIEERSCDYITIYGLGFVEGDSLTCVFTGKKVGVETDSMICVFIS